MNNQIKLIWDFRGPEALHTASHHLIHLKEYLLIENIDSKISACEHISEFHSIAYIVVPETQMIAIRDALKPHRGEYYTENI